VAGSVVLLGAVVAGALMLSGGDDKGSSSSGSSGGTSGGSQAIKLVTPETLDGGTYLLDKDTAALKEEGTSVQEGMPAGATSVLARYKRADDPTGASGLAFSGAYGRIGQPDTVENDMYKGFEMSSSATVEKERQEYQPEGPGGPTIDCEVVKMQGLIYVPVCTWAEESDAAMVMDIDAKNISAGSVDVEAFAKVTAGIYQDTRKPA
jgi:hypothetical protein